MRVNNDDDNIHSYYDARGWCRRCLLVSSVVKRPPHYRASGRWCQSRHLLAHRFGAPLYAFADISSWFLPRGWNLQSRCINNESAYLILESTFVYSGQCSLATNYLLHADEEIDFISMCSVSNYSTAAAIWFLGIVSQYLIEEVILDAASSKNILPRPRALYHLMFTLPMIIDVISTDICRGDWGGYWMLAP